MTTTKNDNASPPGWWESLIADLRLTGHLERSARHLKIGQRELRTYLREHPAAYTEIHAAIGEYRDQTVDSVISHMRDGKSFRTACIKTIVSLDLIRAWSPRYPELVKLLEADHRRSNARLNRRSPRVRVGQ